MVVVRFIESDIVLSINDIVACVDIVSLEDHFKDFRLVHGSFLHEVDDFILNNDGVVNIVIQLNLNLVFHLTLLCKEILFLNWFCEIFVVFCEQVEFANMGPGVEPVTKRILSVESHVLSTLQKVNLMDLPLEVLPIENMRQPRKSIEEVEQNSADLPVPGEGIDEEDVPRERNH